MVFFIPFSILNFFDLSKIMIMRHYHPSSLDFLNLLWNSYKKSSYTRILKRPRACHVTYQLKISILNLQLANQSQNRIQKPALCWVFHIQIHRWNFKLIDHVTSLMPYKVSNCLYVDGKNIAILSHFNYAHSISALFCPTLRASLEILDFRVNHTE